VEMVSGGAVARAVTVGMVMLCSFGAG